MRFALLPVVIVATALAQAPTPKQQQTGYCPKTAVLEASPQQQFWFEGTLGKRHVRMYLDRGGDGVVGVFYDTADWVPVLLGGKWMSGPTEKMELIARSERDVGLGVMKGRLTANGLVGEWTQGNEDKEIAFHLKGVPQPKCDGKEPWKSFNDSHWPITFSYPASWHISTAEKSVTLTCPDASWMAYEEQEIHVLQGADEDKEPTDFVQCGEKWIYGYDCKCGRERDGCQTAAAENREGMTVLKADKLEWRVYCRDGGYVGSGWGDRRILTFEDTWIVVEAEGTAAELVERIAGSAKRRR